MLRKVYQSKLTKLQPLKFAMVGLIQFWIYITWKKNPVLSVGSKVPPTLRDVQYKISDFLRSTHNLKKKILLVLTFTK